MVSEIVLQNDSGGPLLGVRFPGLKVQPYGYSQWCLQNAHIISKTYKNTIYGEIVMGDRG